MTAAAKAGATLLAAVAAFLATYALCVWAGAQAQPAISAALLAVALGRRRHAVRVADVPAGALRLAFVAVAAAGVGGVLHAWPYAGAAVFVAVLALAVWARAFGTRARALGALVTLPLIALLVIPAGPAHARGGPVVDVALVIAAGVVAYVMVALTGLLAPAAAPTAAPQEPAAPERARRRGGPSVPARMALQLAVALSAAFALGFALFPEHVGWTVLTAFIVCSGARGRGDALYKAVLRLGGALAGTLAALLLTFAWAPRGIAGAVLIFAVLYLGLWLRERNYAYWAGAMTLIFALLSRPGATFAPAAFGVRLEAILAGAVCGVAAAWFVMPIRTVDVIRRRLADALAAFDELVAHAHLTDERPARLARFEHHLAELDRVAPPVRWHRRVIAFRRPPEHPAAWIDLAGGLRPHAHALDERADRGAIRRAIGVSRRAIANHGAAEPAPELPAIGAALAALHAALGRGDEELVGGDALRDRAARRV